MLQETFLPLFNIEDLCNIPVPGKNDFMVFVNSLTSAILFPLYGKKRFLLAVNSLRHSKKHQKTVLSAILNTSFKNALDQGTLQWNI